MMNTILLSDYPAMVQPASAAEFYLLPNRQYYGTSHIRVPDLDGVVGAIQVNQHHYSYLKTVLDPAAVLSLVLHLSDRDIAVALTPCPQGYVVWGAEPEAIVTRQHSAPHQVAQPCRILSFLQSSDARGLPTGLSIVSDRHGQPMLHLNGIPYAIVRLEPDAAKTLRLISQISQHQTEAAIALTPAGYAVLRQTPAAALSA